jgi:hypothetical protein
MLNPAPSSLEPRSLLRGLIFEGIGAAGKTSTAAALKHLLLLEPDNERSLVALTETYTQVLNEVHGQLVRLTRLEHLRLLERQIGLLDSLAGHVGSLGARTRRSSGLFFLLERVHLNHRAAFSAEPGFDKDAISKLEDRLVRLGAKCVVLTVHEDHIEDRALVRRGVGFNSSAERGEAVARIVAEQDWVRTQIQHSSIPTRIMNTDRMNWDEIARASMDFLEER